jgi:hypothetical protein
MWFYLWCWKLDLWQNKEGVVICRKEEEEEEEEEEMREGERGPTGYKLNIIDEFSKKN